MFGRKEKNDTAEPVRLGPCEKHSFDHAVAGCDKCSKNYCEACLVYPFGPKKRPYCINCALVVAGVRR